MKIKKNRQRKTFQFSRNRKRVKNNYYNTGKIKDPIIRKFWEKKSVLQNVNNMGLAADPNKTIPIPNTKQQRLQTVKLANGFIEEDIEDETAIVKQQKPIRTKEFVAKMIEDDAKAPREKRFRLPKGYIENLAYFLDKYKLDYKAMVSDKKNCEQWTWKQFRSKMHRFMSLNEQFHDYLKSRNIDISTSLNWTEYTSDDE